MDYIKQQLQKGCLSAVRPQDYRHGLLLHSALLGFLFWMRKILSEIQSNIVVWCWFYAAVNH